MRHRWSWREAPSSTPRAFGTWVVWKCEVCGTDLKECVLMAEAPEVRAGTFNRPRPFDVTAYREKTSLDCASCLAKNVMRS